MNTEKGFLAQFDTEEQSRIHQEFLQSLEHDAKQPVMRHAIWRVGDKYCINSTKLKVESIGSKFIRFKVLPGPIDPVDQDRDDWRKGVELIASSLQMDGNLCCVALADKALEMSVEIEQLRASEERARENWRIATKQLQDAEQRAHDQLERAKIINQGRHELKQKNDDLHAELNKLTVQLADAREQKEVAE